jgi:hypothetical protein
MLLGFILMFLPAKTYACSCAYQPDPKKALEEAHVVFSGKVLDIKQGVYGWRNAVRLHVEKGWKGVDQTEIIVLTNAGGSPSCGFNFQVGKLYLVYAYLSNETGTEQFHTSTCSRTVSLSSAQSDLEQLGQPYQPKNKINLTKDMTYFKAKNTMFYVRYFYLNKIKPNFLCISITGILLLFGGGMFAYLRQSKKVK